MLDRSLEQSNIIWNLQQLLTGIVIKHPRLQSLSDTLRHRKHRIGAIHANLAALPDKKPHPGSVPNQLCAIYWYKHLALGERIPSLNGIDTTKLWNLADETEPSLLVEKLVWKLLFANGGETA